jgi:hypothetical protein
MLLEICMGYAPGQSSAGHSGILAPDAPTTALSPAGLQGSSQRLVRFLEENSLHKKDFAEMIGVTLSYVYNLLDEKQSFPSRSTTLERMAVVMSVDPESFPEYRHPEEPRLIDPGVEFLKTMQRESGMSHVQFLKRFARPQRLEIVDMWRGAAPLPLDWSKVHNIATILELNKEDIYPYWQNRLQQHLTGGGLEPMSNIGLLNALFQGVKAYLRV